MRTATATLLLSLLGLPALAQDDVELRVIDVGPGLCCVAKIPNPDGRDYVIVYDAGNYDSAGREAAIDGIKALAPPSDNPVIDLLILSHSDADHIGAVEEICDAYRVARVIRPGTWGGMKDKPTKTWQRARWAIHKETVVDACIDMPLSDVEIAPGSTFMFDDAFLTFICGFKDPPDDFDVEGSSEFHNAGSIVCRLYYNTHSVLICGDAVGRSNGDPANTHIATERFMTTNAPVVTIDSDVIIAPHYGADNGSSEQFIAAVSPEIVIFSAGHKHHHPKFSTYQRYKNYGITDADFYRTDRGDNEGSPEWFDGPAGAHDLPNDDHVKIVLPEDASSDVQVSYLP